MTAINALLFGNKIHVFSDGGHYRNGLQFIGSKVRYIPQLDALLTYSGPSEGLDITLNRLERYNPSNLYHACDILPHLVHKADKFSAVLMGITPEGAYGVTVEEDYGLNKLGDMSYVKSLECPTGFDIFDIEGSGLKIVEEQRLMYPVVGAYCQYSVLERDKFYNRILKRWNDKPKNLHVQTRAAKIQDLTVTTLNITNNAITGLVESTTSAVVPNASGYMIIVTAVVTAHYLGTQAGSTALYEISVTRSRDSKLLFTKSTFWSGSTGGSYGQQRSIFGSAADTDATTSETYNLSINVTTNLGGSTQTLSQAVRGYYKKR